MLHRIKILRDISGSITIYEPEGLSACTYKMKVFWAFAICLIATMQSLNVPLNHGFSFYSVGANV